MKKFLLILFLCLFTFSCERGWLHKILNPEEPKEETPPSVTITSPQDNATVSGVVTITAEATANPDRVISNVNFFIDDTLKLSDEASPWEYELNTTEYENGQISIKAIAYDNYDDSDSAVISLYTDNILYQRWEQQHIDSQKVFYAVDFIDSNTGWAVGYTHAIYKTNDGGSNWSNANAGINTNFNDVVAINSDIVFFIGESGIGGEVWKTTDGGSSFSLCVQSETNNWTSAYFIDPNIGYVVGGNSAILKTVDGGDTWTDKTPDSSINTDDLFGVHFDDSNTGWVVGSNMTILKTTDGGSNWSSHLVDDPDSTLSYDSRIYDIHFVDSNTGWAVKQSWGNSGTILKTTNGGSTWFFMYTYNQKTQYGVHFIDDDNGWVATNDGLILSTTNGGNNWSIDFSHESEWNLYDIHFVDYNTGWAVGEFGVIYKLIETTEPP